MDQATTPRPQKRARCPQIVFPPTRDRVTDTTTHPWSTFGQLIMRSPMGALQGRPPDRPPPPLTAAHNVFRKRYRRLGEEYLVRPEPRRRHPPWRIRPGDPGVHHRGLLRKVRPTPTSRGQCRRRHSVYVRLRRGPGCDALPNPIMGMYAAGDIELPDLARITAIRATNGRQTRCGPTWARSAPGISALLFYRINTFRGERRSHRRRPGTPHRQKTIVGVHVAGDPELGPTSRGPAQRGGPRTSTWMTPPDGARDDRRHAMAS